MIILGMVKKCSMKGSPLSLVHQTLYFLYHADGKIRVWSNLHSNFVLHHQQFLLAKRVHVIIYWVWWLQVNSHIRKDTSSTTGWSLQLRLGKLLKSLSNLLLSHLSGALLYRQQLTPSYPGYSVHLHFAHKVNFATSINYSTSCPENSWTMLHKVAMQVWPDLYFPHPHEKENKGSSVRD